MARGDAQRRRKRMFNRANESNLLKASYGKALPFAKLPDAPIKETDKLPASLRRMAQLQAAAEKEEARKAARREQHESQQALRAAAASNPAETQPQVQKSAANASHMQQEPPGAQKARVETPGPSGRGTEQQHTDKHQANQQQQQQQQQQAPPSKKQRLVPAATAAAEERIYKASVFEQSKPKKLKDKKKEFLERRKQQKKKSKGLSGVASQSGQVLVPAELRLKEQQAATSARFGEVADAPLKVQLKRKHWAGQDGAAGQGASGGANASRASHRLTKIFQSQLATAQQRLAGGAATHTQQPPSKKQRKAGQHKGQSSHGQGLSADPLLRAQAAKAQEAKERLRQSVVDAYRSSKKHGLGQGATGASEGAGGAGGASLASLAKLVERGKSMTEAARIR